MCFMFFAICLKAQDTTYQMQFDIAAEKLDKSEMKTSVLYDRAFPFAKLNRQVYAKEELDSIVYNYDYFKQVYLEFNVSDYNAVKYEKFDHMTSRVLEERNIKNKFLIGVLDFDYEYLDTMAFHTGAIQIQNEKLVRDFSVPTSPFLLDRISLLSIMSDRVYTGSTKFVLDANSIYSNTNRSIASIEIYFDEQSNPIKLKPGDSVFYTFSTVGEMEYTYSIAFTNGEVLNADASITVVSAGSEPCLKLDLITNNFFEDYNGLSLNAHYTLAYYFKGNCANRVPNAVYKPIVVLDGFDPNDDRKVGNIYDLFNENPHHLADSLRASGHDIIIMNFLNGADFIERNALALIDLITQLNTATTDKVTIVGPSMGGLIAKYALARLEYMGKPNNVGLYVSFDAPHQGANIPIGDQNFLRFFAEEANSAEAQVGLNKIKSPAAKQMIMHYYSTKNEEITPHDFNIKFKKNLELNSLGTSYPVHLRKIAISNGNDIATEQNVAGKLFSMVKRATVFNIKVAEAQVYASPRIGRSVVSYCMVASPNRFYLGKEERLYAKAPKTIYPSSLDNAPGGKFNTQEQIAKPNGVMNSDFNLYFPHHSFIPSVSALDIQYPDGYLNFRYKIKENKIVCNGYTPFDAYYSAKFNEAHVYISKETADWVEREIRNINKTVEVATNSSILSGNQLFNYGRDTKDIYSKSIQVMGTAVLGINRNTWTGYANEQFPIPNSKFTVEGYNLSCGILNIEMNDSSKLILGDPNGNIGVLKVSDNSVLSLKEGSELIVYNNSTLIIESGNVLSISPRTHIKLLGPNAKIIINGTLELKEDAVFSFSGEGSIELNSNNIIWAKNSSIKLEGQGINHVVLSIQDNKSFVLPFIENNNNTLEIIKASVILKGTYSSINTAASTNFNQVKFIGGRGLILNGQANVSIRNCEFINSQFGVTAFSTLIEKFNIPSSPLRLQNCRFKGNQIAISVYGKGFMLDGIDIVDCKKGILADGIEMVSKIDNSTFTADEKQKNYVYSNAGLTYLGNTGSSLQIVNSQIHNYNIGLYSSMSAVNLKCSKFLNSNYYNVWIANNSSLNLGTNGIYTTGNNSFQVKNGLNNRNICLDNAGIINLKNGQNKFRIANDVQNYFVAGTALNIPSTMDFTQNTWYGDLYSNSYLNPPNQKNFEVKLNVAPSAPRVGSFMVSPVSSLNSSECTATSSDVLKLENDPTENDIITISNYPSGTYGFILEQLLNSIKSDTSNQKIISHYTYLLELIRYAKTSTEISIRNFDLTYQYIHELYNRLYDIEIDYSSKLNLTTELINIIDDRIQILKDSKLVEQLYATLLDKAQLYTRIRDFSQAHEVYTSVFEYANSNTKLNNLNHWICYNSTSKEIAQNNLSIIQIDSLYRLCELEFENMEEVSNPKWIQTADSTSLSFSLYPNPTNSSVRIEFNVELKVNRIELFDLHGKLILNISLNTKIKNYELELDGLDTGVYILKIVTDSDLINSKLFKY